MEVKNFTEYFASEQEIYIQNISGAQISTAIDLGNGRFDSFPIPPSKNPINLTKYFPFDVIKRSTDIRKHLTRRPQILKILSEEEYRQYYGSAAKSTGLFKTEGKDKKVPDIDAAIDRAEEERLGLLNHEPLKNATITEPLHEVIEDDQHFGGHKLVKPKEFVSEDDILNPQVLHLCNQVKGELAEQDRMPAQQFLQELTRLEGSFHIDDWEYVRAHGYYKSVKNYAKKKIAETATDEEKQEKDG